MLLLQIAMKNLSTNSDLVYLGFIYNFFTIFTCLPEIHKYVINLGLRSLPSACLSALASFAM